MINRSAIILRPAQPFLDWAASVDDSGIIPDVEGEQAVYLVPEWEDDKGRERVLKRVFAELFERELFGWHSDESKWPKVRGLREFRKWFRIEMHSLIEDVCVGGIYDDEFDEYDDEFDEAFQLGPE